MKYRGIFEYEYPTEHKPPISIDVHLHGDCVKGKIIEWEYRLLEQEPRKGEWLRVSDLSEQEDDRYKCSRCGNVVHHKNKMDLYTFNGWCGRCGSNNGRHINYEVEE
jgi:DNA-directed RNA polymerase subunit RPC12/RpoP